MTADYLAHILAKHRTRPGALLPILHEVHDLKGHIPADVVPEIALALNLSRAEVHGVITYYRHFRATPPGRHVVRLCRAEACQSVGAAALIEHAQARLGCGFHETSSDGEVTLEPVYCLGHCSVGPSMQVDEELVQARVTPEAFDALLASFKAKGGAR